jgi:hypothetical protein
MSVDGAMPEARFVRMTSARTRFRAFAVLGLFAAVLLLPGEARGHNGVVLKGWGTAMIDGRMDVGEWSQAARFTMRLDLAGSTVQATVFVMNDPSQLYLALRIPRPVLVDTGGVDFHFDNDHDGNGGELGEDILRLRPSEGALDMYYDPATKTIYPDQRDGGSSDVRGRVQSNGAFSFFEVSHPLDTSDNAHDFSLGAGARVGFAVSFNDCFCAQERISNWPAPGPWADIAIARALPTITLAQARFAARWKASVVTGSLLVAGRTSDGARLEATLSRAGVKGTSVDQRNIEAAPGPFRQAVRLPPTLPPGRYTLKVGGTSDGFPLVAQHRTLELVPPPEGVVRRVLVRATSTTAWGAKASLPAGTRHIWLRFGFAARPRATCTTRKAKGSIEYVCRPPITVTWYDPDGHAAGPPKQKGNGPTIVTVLGAVGGRALRAGTWRCVLGFGGVTVKEFAVTVG